MQDSANAQEVAKMKTVVDAIGRQIVVSELAKEQRVRYEGGSGLTQTRGYVRCLAGFDHHLRLDPTIADVKPACM
jgi:hypothetical protein